MTDTVTKTTALPEILFDLIKTENVRIKQDDGVILLWPIIDKKISEEPKSDCTIGLRGILADCEEMSVDNFLSRQHADMELDL